MRAPLSWIRQIVAVPDDQTGRDVAARLIAAGLEVETVDVLGAEITGPLVVGRVRTVEELTEFRKPIRFCRVEVGTGNGEVADGVPTDERGIVCGASNFASGDLVIVALPGADLGGFAIASRTTYGRTSDGMITSERELGLGEDHDGIIVLPAGSAEPGDSGYDVLGLGDAVLDIAVTPDRGYALSIRGIAREVAIAYGLPFADPALVDAEALLPSPAAQAPHGCSITDPTAADRFVLRSLDGLDPRATSPQWMRRALIACGMRPVSLAVDVTNFVMLELGQPLHAFDRAKLSGPLTVRRAAPGEVLETLDHVRRELDPADVVIADPSRALAVAGVMGGLDSEIDDASHSVAIEAVHFNAQALAAASRRHRLSSEASRRFERGVDAGLPAIASARAAALLIEFGGARYVGVDRVDAVPPVEPIVIDADLPARLAGMDIPAGRAVERLEHIGAEVQIDGDRLVVTPPSWRPDLTDPFDLVEEVVRLEGYENLPSTLPTAPPGFGLTVERRLRRRVGRTLAASGLVEVLSYPFVGEGDIDALGLPDGDDRRALVRLANPLSDEAPLLRTTLLPGLIAAARRNLSRGQTDLALAEVGLVFLNPGGEVPTNSPPRPSVQHRPDASDVAALEALLPAQPRHAAGLLTGERDRHGWWGQGRAADWSDALAVVRDLADELGVDLEVTSATHAPWHPGRCAAVSVGGRIIGHAGELHPRVVGDCGLPARTVAFEIDLDALIAAVPPVAQARALSSMPVAKEDLALVVADHVPAEAVRAAILAGGGELLESVRLFDTYAGEQIGEGRRSLAFALRLRATDRTLSATEVAEVRRAALSAAQERCGAVLRG